MAKEFNQTWRKVRDLVDELREHGVVIKTGDIALEMWASDDDLQNAIDALRAATSLKKRMEAA